MCGHELRPGRRFMRLQADVWRQAQAELWRATGGIARVKTMQCVVVCERKEDDVTIVIWTEPRGDHL